MATDPAVAPPPLPPAPPTGGSRASVAPPPDPTKHLWQLPVLVLGVGLFVAAWQGWLAGAGDDPPRAFALEVSRLKAEYEKALPDPVGLKMRLASVAAEVEKFPDQAALARFCLGSGYVRLAELTPGPEEARGYWTLAQQHFALVSEAQLRDPADAAKFPFRSTKARAAAGLAPDTPQDHLVLMINVLSTGQTGEDAGDASRLIADLVLRLNPPNYARAKVELARYVQSGLATPTASLNRGRLRLGQLYVLTHEYDLARKALFDIDADAPPDVQGPAKAELAKVLMADGNWSEAANQLKQLREVWPPLRASAAYQLGVCKLMLRERDAAAKVFEEATKGDGPEASAAALRLADLYLRGADKDRHKEAVELLVSKFKGVRNPGEYDAGLVPANDARATFELAVTTLLNDAAEPPAGAAPGYYSAAYRVTDAYAAVSASGRDREMRAEVLGKWGTALKEAGGDAKPKLSAAADEYAALAPRQPKPDGKLEMLRRSASFSRLADDPYTAATRLEEAIALEEIPDQVVPALWFELADALLAANRFDEVWKVINKVLGQNSKYSTAMRDRLARQFVTSRHPEFVKLGRLLFEQIANKQTVESGEREFHERALSELANMLIREGNYADAENRLRTQLRLYEKGPGAGRAKLFLGICLLQRATAANLAVEDATRMRKEALALFKENVAACDGIDRRGVKLNPEETWLRNQSAIRVLQAHQQLRSPTSARDLLYDAVPLLERYRGTVEELIVFSFMYHAFRQVNDTGKALEIRDKMKDAYDKLPDSAFPQKEGEYSREYWRTLWFAPEKK